MNCPTARDALSARLDDAPLGVEPAALDVHLAACPSCRAWGASAAELIRRARLHVVPQMPDLTAAVQIGVQQARQLPRPGWTPARLGLVLLGTAQLLLSLPPLLGAEVGTSVHVSREVGVTQVALAVGVLAAAARPWRAAGMLPVVLALALGLAVVAGADVLTGRVAWTGEVVHLLPLADALLLWLVRHRDPLPGPAGASGAGGQQPGQGPRLASSA